jgi:crotonobetainyl-CoA:carnitine CoA-transferase CaiB-like acyl-CoA transferase
VTLALEGLQVVDISQGVPGPFCAMQLGDFGADVIKLEPTQGDWLRGVGPFVEGESSVFLQVNRNKRGVAVDLKTAEGRAILDKLLSIADVLVEGYRPGVMQRLGFAYDEVSARYPRLIYCSITGYGTRGPLAQAPATELDVQFMVGSYRHLGVAGESPLRLGFDLASTAAGMAGVQGVLTALYWRERNGLGQHVETSMLAAMTAVHQWPFSAEHSPDTWEGRTLRGLTDPPDYGFMTLDGPALLGLRGNEGAWTDLLLAIGREGVLADPRFSTVEAMMENQVYLPEAINDTLRHWRYEDLRHLVQDELGGTISRAHTMETLWNDPQTTALDMRQTIEGHPKAGPLPTLDPPWDSTEEFASLRLPPPLLGQHTAEVLHALGYDAGEIARVAREGIIRSGEQASPT